MSLLGLPRPYWGLVVCSGGLFVSIGMGNILVPASVVDRFGQDVERVGLIVSVFLGASIAFRPLAARAASVVGPRRVLMVATILYSVALCAMSMATVPLLGGAARGVAGAAQGAAYLVTLASIMRSVPARLVARALSISSLVVFVGLALGPVVADWLLTMASLTVVWMVAAAVPLVALLFGVSGTPLVEGDRPEGTSDPPPRVALLSLAAPALLLALGSVAYGCFQTLVPLAAVRSGVSAGVVFAVVSLAVLVTQLAVVGWGHAIGPVARAAGSVAAGSISMLVLGAFEGGWRFGVAAALLGLATALLFPAVLHGTVGHLRGRDRTRALAFLSPGFEIGQIGGALLGGAVAGGASFRAAFIACAALASLGLFLAPVLRRDSGGFNSR